MTTPWDSPERTRRTTENPRGVFHDISNKDWLEFEWYDVTEIGHPEEMHVYIKGRRVPELSELPEVPER